VNTKAAVCIALAVLCALFLALFIASKVQFFTRSDPLWVGGFLREHIVYWGAMAAIAFSVWLIDRFWRGKTTAMTDKNYIDSKSYWADPDRNIRRMGHEDGQQRAILKATEACSEAEWAAVSDFFQNYSPLTFGYPEEWKDFEKRNPLFVKRYPRLQKGIEIAFKRNTALEEPIDKFIFMFGRLCVEDLYEIVMCCGNAYGYAGQKLLRGLYERAVTLRYLHEHPEEIEDFLDYHHVSQRKLKIACEETMGADTLAPEQAAEIESEFAAVKKRFMVCVCEKCGTKRLNHTWSKLDFVAMAKKTCLGKLFAIGYVIPLRHAHATVASMISRMELTDEGATTFKWEAQRKEADAALRAAHNVFLDILRVQEERFGVPGLKEQNEVCLQDFVDIWQKDSSA
jgi:hypothetical protein